MRASRGLALGLLPLLLAACADPMSGRDGISPVAGLAQVNNAQVHIIDPNGLGGGANPGASGQRAARVIDAYQAGEITLEPVAGGSGTGIDE